MAVYLVVELVMLLETSKLAVQSGDIPTWILIQETAVFGKFIPDKV